MYESDEDEDLVLEEVEDIVPEALDHTRERVGAERIGKPVLNRLAMAQLIAKRAKQLQLGYPSTLPSHVLRSTDEKDIALQELEEQLKHPDKDIFRIRIRRNNPDGTYEIWRVGEFVHYPIEIQRPRRKR